MCGDHIGSNSLTGARYVLAVVDDYSRATWIYMMKEITQVFSMIKNFMAMVKRQFVRRIKTIRTDSSKEFVNNNCQVLFSEEGIIHQRCNT